MEILRHIGVIGDIHTEEILLQLAVNFLKQNNVEKIFCTGDIADGRGDINQCCRILKKEKIITVMGNHDRWLLQDEMRNLQDASLLKELSQQSKELIHNLPKTVNFSTHQGIGLLCHGLAENDMARVSPDDYGYAIEANADLQKILKEQKYRYIINGHTHKRMVRKFQDTFIINAGTLKREHKPCFSIVDFVARKVHFFKFNGNNSIKIIDNHSFE